jgi:hypothetical protein
MNKVRPEALWNELLPEQRKILDTWLFEEKLSYPNALERAKNELGFRGSLGSLKRYGKRRRQERTLAGFDEARRCVAGISHAPTNPKTLRTASMKVLGCYLLEQVQEALEAVKEWGPVANLIVQNDHNEAMRELKGEENRIRREKMKFAKEKFQYDLMEKALKALPELLALAEVKKDPQAKRYEENAHWNRLRRVMFGTGIDIHPESAQEEAEMMAAKQEREARREEESEREREKIIDAQPPPPSSPYYQEYMETVAKREEEGWNAGEMTKP